MAHQVSKNGTLIVRLGRGRGSPSAIESYRDLKKSTPGLTKSSSCAPDQSQSVSVRDHGVVADREHLLSLLIMAGSQDAEVTGMVQTIVPDPAMRLKRCDR